MKEDRHPGNRGQCPFYIDPADILTAHASIYQCVDCAIRGDGRLESCRDDFQQLAYLTILEETPKYDPKHPSKASFITFIKAKVCLRLWSQRRQELKYLSCPIVEPAMSEFSGNTLTYRPNPLAAELYNTALAAEALEDEVINAINVDEFRQRLTAMLDELTEQEQKVVRLKYFEDYTGTQIANALGVSKGRVSQVIKKGLAKLKTAYLRFTDGCSV